MQVERLDESLPIAKDLLYITHLLKHCYLFLLADQGKFCSSLGLFGKLLISNRNLVLFCFNVFKVLYHTGIHLK